MHLGIGLGITHLSGVLFSPSSLFANDEAGAWYDPSDLSTLFQDTAGTTPAGVGDPVGLILDKSKGRNYPAQFFPDIPIPLFSADTAIQAALVENALIANSGVYYVSPSTGSDSNAGTEAAPFQTVSQAIRTATGAASRVVMLEDAVIEPFDLRSTDASQTTQQFKWLDANGFDVTIRVAGPDLSSQTFTKDGTYTNCYTTVLSIGASAQVTRVLNQSLADDYGYDTPLREYSSEALLDAATDKGYYWDNSTKTLWMNIGGNVDAFKANYRALYTDSGGNSRIFISGASLGLSGVKLEGVQIFSLDAAGIRPEVWMHNVEQVYPVGKGGDIRGWYVATDCTVYGSEDDGCNAFAAWAGGKSLIQDVRCRFIRSGDRRTFDVSGTRQGVSAQGGSYHIAHDSEYIENNGGGVADLCANSSIDYSWLVECRVVGGAPGVTVDNFLFGSAGTSAARIAFLDNCVSESSSANDLSVQVNGTVQRLNSNFATVFGVSLPYGDHATQSTPTARPTLQSAGGLYYLDFDGVDDYLQGPAHPFTFAGAISFYAGFNITGTKAFSTLFSAGAVNSGALNANKAMAFQYSSNTSLPVGNRPSLATDIYAPSGVWAQTTSPLVTATDYVAGFVIADWSNHKTSGTSARINGTAQTVASYGAAVPTDLNASPTYIGAFDPVALASSFADTNIYGMIVLDRTLTAAEITSLESYLAAKSGVTL